MNWPLRAEFGAYLHVELNAIEIRADGVNLVIVSDELAMAQAVQEALGKTAPLRLESLCIGNFILFHTSFGGGKTRRFSLWFDRVKNETNDNGSNSKTHT